MKLILLTHTRELSKQSNTGQLVQQYYASCERIIWQRTQPDSALLKTIESGNTALVYPSQDSVELSMAAAFQNFILIDSTWQEARKMYNHSPYLHALPQIKIIPAQTSNFRLRRNQPKHGLCTAESAIELLNNFNMPEDAQRLLTGFQEFQNQKPH